MCVTRECLRFILKEDSISMQSQGQAFDFLDETTLLRLKEEDEVGFYLIFLWFAVSL